METARRRSQRLQSRQGEAGWVHTLCQGQRYIRTARWAEPGWGNCHTPQGTKGHPSRERWATCGQSTRDTGDTRSCVGSVPAPSRPRLHPGEEPRKQSLSPQPAPAAPAYPCTHRTSGLMISRPGGRGYKARILSHKAMSQGSTTASGLQVRHSGYSNIIPPGSNPATPACAQQLSPQSPHAIPFQLQVWEETYLSHSKHSLSRAQPLTPEEFLQRLNSTCVVTKSLSHPQTLPGAR